MNPALIIIYFFYGLSFFAMGLAVLLETGRSPALAEGRILRCLAAFGVLHGTHEWLESYLLQAASAGTQMPDWLDWFRLALLTSSFLALFGYAYWTLQLASERQGLGRFHHFGRLALYEALMIASLALTYRGAIHWLPLLDALSRYLLAAPAAVLAGIALHSEGRRYAREGWTALLRPMNMAAAAFALYAFGQFFVKPIDAFPALYLNQEAFLAVTGAPIQLLRTVAAVLVTIGVIRAIQIIEQGRQAQLAEAHRARLAALEEREALRRDLLQHVVRSQEDERARIARELHDDVAQSLSAFSLELAALRSAHRKADAVRMVDHLQSLSRQMSQSLYRLVHDLRPSNLDDLGLVPALNTLAAQDCQQKGLRVEFSVTGDQRRLDALVETVLFRVAQEALANVCRHAGTQQARIDLDYQADRVRMCIADRGIGFDPTEQFHPPRGWGLAGMRERVESLAGELHLHSAAGQGTTVDVMLPLRGAAQKESANGKDHPVAG